MILLMQGNGIITLIALIYLVCHSPAIVMVIIGLVRLKSKPQLAKKLLILSGIYFLIGWGVCGSLLVN